MSTETITAKHTPGPWTREPLQRFKHDGSAGIRGPRNTYVAAALDFNSYDRDAEVEANAVLIAAAPDLLAACKFALSQMEAAGLVCGDLRAAIDKAMTPIA